MHSDGSHNGIALSIDNADITRTRIDHVDFVLFGVGCDASGFDSDFYSFRRLKCAQVNDGDRIALAVGDVGILAIKRAVVGQRTWPQIPPQQPACNPEEDSE